MENHNFKKGFSDLKISSSTLELLKCRYQLSQAYNLIYDSIKSYCNGDEELTEKYLYDENELDFMTFFNKATTLIDNEIIGGIAATMEKTKGKEI